jgi:hypothetical protein
MRIPEKDDAVSRLMWWLTIAKQRYIYHTPSGSESVPLASDVNPP